MLSTRPNSTFTSHCASFPVSFSLFLSLLSISFFHFISLPFTSFIFFLSVHLISSNFSVYLLSLPRSPCIPPGTTLDYEYGDHKYKAQQSSAASAAACMQVARSVVEDASGSFRLAPNQPVITRQQQVFAMSYYFDRAIDIGKRGVEQEEQQRWRASSRSRRVAFPRIVVWFVVQTV